MYNSQNYASSKVSFTSAVLAQATLLDIPTFLNGVISLDAQSVYGKVFHKIDLFTQDTKGKISISNYEFEV